MASPKKKAFLKGFRAAIFHSLATVGGVVVAADPALFGITGPWAGVVIAAQGVIGLLLRGATTTPIGKSE